MNDVNVLSILEVQSQFTEVSNAGSDPYFRI